MKRGVGRNRRRALEIIYRCHHPAESGQRHFSGRPPCLPVCFTLFQRFKKSHVFRSIARSTAGSIRRASTSWYSQFQKFKTPFLSDRVTLDFDPEDVQISGIDPSDLDQRADSSAREHYVQVGYVYFSRPILNRHLRPCQSTSAIRKLHDTIADSKYDGIRTTRTQLMEQSSTDGLDSDGDVREDVHEGGHIQSPGSRSSDEEQASSSDVDQEVDRIQAPIQTPISQDHAEDLSSTLRKTRDEDRKKGKAVARQIVRSIYPNIS